MTKKMRQYLIFALCLVLVSALSIGGTMAWLQAQTNQVKNTFSPSNIGLTLDEADTDDTDKDGNTTERDLVNNYKMTPGEVFFKDPIVTIENDVAAYLFVEVDEDWSITVGEGDDAVTYTLTDYLDYELCFNAANSGWTQGNGTNVPSNVWYRTVMADDTTKSWHLLAAGEYGYNGTTTVPYAEDHVAVKTSVTDEMMEALKANGVEQPSIAFTAYAIQYYNGGYPNTFPVGTAWELASNQG